MPGPIQIATGRDAFGAAHWQRATVTPDSVSWPTANEFPLCRSIALRHGKNMHDCTMKERVVKWVELK